MKYTPCLAMIAAVVASLTIAAQPTPFRNLDFEEANPPILGPNDQGGAYPIADLIPGWTAQKSGQNYDSVVYHTISIAAPDIGLVDAGNIFFRPIGDLYSVSMQGDRSPYGVSLSQTGLIPADSHSIFLRAVQGDFIMLSINGIGVPLQHISDATEDPNRTVGLWGADISPFAGTSVDLRLSVAPPPPNSFQVFYLVDDIQFSPAPVVPEPAAWMLLLGGGALGMLFLRGRHSVRRH